MKLRCGPRHALAEENSSLYHRGMNGEGPYRVIDRSTWPRREQFDLFKGFGFPYFSVTAEIDITPYRRALPRGGQFTLGIVYALASAANSVPPFRQRIRGEDVIEFEVVHPSIILLNDEEAFRFCALPFAPEYALFTEGALERMETARAASSMFDVADQDDFLFLTSLPWISFQGVLHAVPTQPSDSVPRIAWGKARDVNGQLLLPLNTQVHHALVDGLHVARFFERAEERLQDALSWLVAS